MNGKKQKKILCLMSVLILCMGFYGCSGIGKKAEEGKITSEDKEWRGTSEDSVTRDIFAMDTYMTITAYGEQAKQAVDEAVEEINRLDALLSTGNEKSEISVINRQGGGTLSEDTAYLLKRSGEISKSTKGAFDVTIYPVMQLWGFTSGNYKVPDEQSLKQKLNLVDSNQIKIDEANKKISFGLKGMEIDLGGITKGYTSGRLMDIFKKHQIKSAVVSLGGNVQVLGKKTDGSDWKVAVENPNSKEAYLGVLSVENKAVITSGGYERYFEENGKRYHHVIDPSTGYPAENGLTSVTIVSEDGTLADGLSTALFVMGKDKAVDYWRQHKEQFDAILVDEKGNIYVTSGIAHSFSAKQSYEIIK